MVRHDEADAATTTDDADPGAGSAAARKVGSAIGAGRKSVKDFTKFASATSMATRLPAAVVIVSLLSLLAAIIVAVPTSKTCRICGGFFARNAAIPAIMVSG